MFLKTVKAGLLFRTLIMAIVIHVAKLLNINALIIMYIAITKEADMA